MPVPDKNLLHIPHKFFSARLALELESLIEDPQLANSLRKYLRKQDIYERTNYLEIERWAERIPIGSGGYPPAFVAASDATDEEKEAADFTCDGTADEEEIQEALDTGNDVFVSSGTFNFASEITLSGAQWIISTGIASTTFTNSSSTFSDYSNIGDWVGDIGTCFAVIDCLSTWSGGIVGVNCDFSNTRDANGDVLAAFAVAGGTNPPQFTDDQKVFYRCRVVAAIGWIANANVSHVFFVECSGSASELLFTCRDSSTGGISWLDLLMQGCAFQTFETESRTHEGGGGTGTRYRILNNYFDGGGIQFGAGGTTVDEIFCVGNIVELTSGLSNRGFATEGTVNNGLIAANNFVNDDATKSIQVADDVYVIGNEVTGSTTHSPTIEATAQVHNKISTGAETDDGINHSVSGVSHDTDLVDVSADDHHTQDHASRHQADGADPFSSHDASTLTDTTPGTADTYEQWGTEEVTFPNPSVDVRVLAEALGSLSAVGAAAAATGKVKTQISLDGGTSWTDGSEPEVNVADEERQLVGSFADVEGTPTGEIQVRAQVQASVTDVIFEQGRIHARYQRITLPFNPVTSVAWFAAYWAEGTEFDAEGYSDGNSVDNWPDEVGTNDLTNATAAEQPVFRSSVAALNNKPAIEDDGVDDHLDSPDFTDLTQPNTIVIVGKVDGDLSQFQPFVDAAPVDTTGRHTVGIINTPIDWIISAGTNQTGSAADTNAHLFIATFDGVSSTLEVDGVEDIAADAGADTLGSLRLFHNFSDSTLRPLNGKIAFAGIKDGTLTAQEKADLEAWAADHYGITIS